MTKHIILPLLCAGAAALTLTSCNGNKQNDGKPEADSAVVAAPVVLHGDTAINRALRFYAGVSKDGVQMSASDAHSWDSYSATIKACVDKTAETRNKIEELAKTDFADFRDSVNYVLYPFAAADFLYPISIYPNADTYFLCGLEQTGTPITADIKTNYAHYEAYRHALQYYLSSTYFLTNGMKTEFHNNELDGVAPVVTMLMAVAGREVISIKKKDLDAEGNLIDSTDPKSILLEVKFFHPDTNTHEQTLLYASGDVSNSGFDARLKKYLEKTLPQHRVGSFAKAASYLMHNDSFSTMRSFVIDNAMAVVEDDSGIPVRFFTENNKFDITLYGTYTTPIPLFAGRRQSDLYELYNGSGKDKVRPLPFNIGYKTPSNWLVARKKK